VPLEKDLDDGVPLLFAHVEDHPLAENSRAADDRVQISERLDRGLDHRFAARHRRDALGKRDRPTAARLDLLDHGVRRLARRMPAVHAHAVVVDDHARAGSGASERDGAADPCSATRHDDDLSVELSHDGIAYAISV
jgi:hypothetical protein